MKSLKIFLLILCAQSECALHAGCIQDINNPPLPCDTSVAVPPLPITDPVTFPLDPLTPAEMCQAVNLVRAYPEFPAGDPRTLFDRVELQLPSKQFVLSYAGGPFTRKAFVAVYSPGADLYFASTVNLTTNTVETFQIVPDARPSWTNVDNDNVVELILQDPDFLAAMEVRGITQADLDCGRVQFNVNIDGRLDNRNCSQSCTKDLPNLNTRPRPRSYYATAYLLDGCPTSDTPINNYFLQPIEGLVIWVDENAQPCGKVLKVTDTGVAPINQGLINVNCPPNAFYDAYRGTLKPLAVCQPDGPSYTITGNEIIWEKWRFRFQMHPTFGIVLNLISYNDKQNSTDPDNYRLILYQANLAEAITAYGTSDTGAKMSNFLDLGEYQNRLFITPLQAGVDVPPYAQLFNTIYVDEYGTLTQYDKSFAIYEQDGGLLWRHYDSYNGLLQGRRGRELVLTHTNCIGNYDYAFYWIFKQDGSIEVKVILTGMDEFQGIDQSQVPPEVEYGELVRQNLIAANHQHYFNYRLDFDIDGQVNRAYEVNNIAVDSALENPCANAWNSIYTLLPTSSVAQRNVNPFTNREWLFVNPNSFNNLGQERGYAIEPGENSYSLNGRASRISKRAAFLHHNLFVTQYQEDALYPMGKYPVEKGHDEGLRIYAAEDQNLVDRDIVAWYTMLFSHHPAPENVPILPAETLSFKIFPDAFFNQSPAIDVDPDQFICCSTCPTGTCEPEPNFCP